MNDDKADTKVKSKFSGLMAAVREREDADIQKETDTTELLRQTEQNVLARIPASEHTQTILTAAETPKRGRPRGKRSNPGFEQVTAYISRETHREVKIALLREGEGREFSEIVEELLANWLRSKN